MVNYKKKMEEERERERERSGNTTRSVAVMSGGCFWRVWLGSKMESWQTRKIKLEAGATELRNPRVQEEKREEERAIGWSRNGSS